MPFPNEHSCRLRNPADFKADSFRRITREHEGKEYSVIVGRLKGETSMTEQAYRYNRETWSASSARSHCEGHDGSFEAAEPKSQALQIERRFVACAEVRAVLEPERIISGLAATYYDGTPTTEYELWPDAIERIMPGAFTQALSREADIRALFNHEPSAMLGRTIAGSLQLEDSPKGLLYHIKAPETQLGRDLLTLIGRGDINGSSFSFTVKRENWRTEGDKQIREIQDVELYDVGPVTFPAYPDTTVAVRSHEVWCKQNSVQPDVIRIRMGMRLKLEEG